MRFSYLLLFFLFPILQGYRLDAYLGNWQSYNGYPPCKIPGDKFARLIYDSFNHLGCYFNDEHLELNKTGPMDGVCGSPDQPSNDTLKGNMYQLLQIKKRFPHLQIIANLVGSTEMHNAITDPVKRQAWVTSCANMFAAYPSVFDGINIDLEYPCVPDDPYCGGIVPSSDDRTAFSQFVVAMKQGLPLGQNWLSVALSIDPKKHQAIDFSYLDSFVDVFHLMTYNVADGAWSTYTGHHTPPYNNPADPSWDSRRYFTSELAAKSLISFGVPKTKIFIASCFYGRGFRVSPGQYTSPFVLSSGVTGLGTYGTQTQNIFYYWDIKANYLRNDTYHFDEVAQAAFVLDPVQGIYISFDDVRSIKAKTDIIKNLGLGGILIWELGMDSNHELLNASLPSCLEVENCRYPTKEIPGKLTLDQTPQFVILQLEDAVTSSDFKTIGQFPDLLKNANTTYQIVDSLGCVPSFTGYFSGRYLDYNMVNYANRIGSVAMRGYSMNTNRDTVQSDWKEELSTLQTDFNYLAQTTPSGSRAPYFQTNDAYYQTLLDMGIKFDSSMVVNDPVSKSSVWPFTLDYPELINPNYCNYMGKCPSKPYRGVWEFPITSFDYNDPEDFFNYKVTTENYQTLMQAYKQNFMDTYTKNKAPRAINLRWNYFSNGWFDIINPVKQQFVLEFLSWMVYNRSDVIFATESQVIDWIKNPIPLNQILQSCGTRTCPNPKLTPEKSCSDGNQMRCVYSNGIHFTVCGNLCPNAVPDLWMTWNLVSQLEGDLVEMYSVTDPGAKVSSNTIPSICQVNTTSNTTLSNSTTPSNQTSSNSTSNTTLNTLNTTSSNSTANTTNMNSSNSTTINSSLTYPSNHFMNHWNGTFTLFGFQAWETGFCCSISITNPNLVKHAIGFMFVLRFCKSFGSISSTWGGKTNKVVLVGHEYQWKLNAPDWTDVSPGQKGAYLGGFCMQTTTAKTRAMLEAASAWGIDFYETQQTCSLDACEIFCGNTYCMKSTPTGSSTCNKQCRSLVNCD